MKKLLPVLLLGIAACTQSPVSVVFKGDQIFGRGNQTASTQTGNPYHSSFEIQTEGVAEAQRVGNVGVSELPPLKGISQEQTFTDNTSPQGKMVPQAYQPAVQNNLEIPAETNQAAPHARMMQAAVRVESPAGGSDISQNWYQGKVVLAKADSGAEMPHGAEAVIPQSQTRFIWPVRGKVISHFGPKANGLHNDGINIATYEGEPFYAAADGVVVYAASDLKGYGNMAILRHAEGWMTAYAHAQKLLVKENERVRQGQQIGIVGKSGSVREAQLHFGLRQGKSPVDPAKYLGSDYAAR